MSSDARCLVIGAHEKAVSPARIALRILFSRLTMFVVRRIRGFPSPPLAPAEPGATTVGPFAATDLYITDTL